MCPTPRRIEVAAIKRDQRAGGFQDRVRLLRQRLTAGVRKPWRQAVDGVELADEHSGRRRRGLTDLIERELDEPLETYRRHPHPEPAASVVPVALERRPLGQRE